MGILRRFEHIRTSTEYSVRNTAHAPKIPLALPIRIRAYLDRDLNEVL